MKTFPMCSNPECSPLQPLAGELLIRKYFDDTEYGRCPECKGIFHIPTMTNGFNKKFVRGISCPKCRKTGKNTYLKPKKRWGYQCLKCGRTY